MLSFFLQGFISKWKLSLKKVKSKVGNNLEIEVKYIRVVKLSLESDFKIFLENTFHILYRWNLISVFSLNRLGFGFDFRDGKINLMFNF